MSIEPLLGERQKIENGEDQENQWEMRVAREGKMGELTIEPLKNFCGDSGIIGILSCFNLHQNHEHF